jgi:UDP-N-acetylmuramate dehydrogenase
VTARPPTDVPSEGAAAADTAGSSANPAEAPFDALALGTEIQRRVGVKTSRDEPLARFTTMRVGGPADLFAIVHNAFELRALVRFARSRGLPHFILGRGSDVVVSDRGIRGLVILDRAEGSRVDGNRYAAEAGVPMARAATETQRAGLTGLEFGLAIPGTVGGAVWANAGAHGSDVASVIESADVLLRDGSAVQLAGDELQFAYRDSRFKRGELEDMRAASDVVVSATFHLRPSSADDIKASLDEIRHWRQAHQPLGMASAGSVFRNPSDGPSAGELIEQAGLKGLRAGGAVVSEKHANFIVNDRRGRAADVRRLAERVREEIEDRDGIQLELEIVFIGDWGEWPWPDEDAG